MPQNVPIYTNPDEVQQQGVIQKPEEERIYLTDKQGYINAVNPETNKPYAPIQRRETAYADDNTGIFYADLLTEKPQARPELDERNQRRLKNRAMFDALGRTLLNVGDSATLGAGGIPVLRDKAQTDKWVDEYYKNIGEHQKNLQEWEYRDYLRRLQTAKTAANQKNIDTVFNKSVDDAYNNLNQWDEQQRLDVDKFRGHNEEYVDTSKLNKDELDALIRYRNQQNAIDRERLKIEDEKNIAVSDVYTPANPDRPATMEFDIRKKELPGLVSRALSDPEFLKKHPDIFIDVPTKQIDEKGNTVFVKARNPKYSDETLAVLYKDPNRGNTRYDLTEGANSIPLSDEGERARDTERSRGGVPSPNSNPQPQPNQEPPTVPISQGQEVEDDHLRRQILLEKERRKTGAIGEVEAIKQLASYMIKRGYSKEFTNRIVNREYPQREPMRDFVTEYKLTPVTPKTNTQTQQSNKNTGGWY